MSSIRARLLAWLLSAVALGALLGGVVTYRNMLHEIEGQFDYQLRQMALSLRDQGSVSPEDAAAIADEQMDFVIQIWSLDGVRIYASQAPLGFPPRTVLGFSDFRVDGTTWRVFGASARDRVIQVAQPNTVRRDLAAAAALRSVAPMFGLVPLLAAIVWMTVGAALAPLRRVAQEVKGRGANALEPIEDPHTPSEIAPLMDALNEYLSRLRAAFSAQRAFVADAAHELRSPLTALKLQLGLLATASSETARHAAMDSLSEGIDRATRLVEQLLTLARNEPGTADVPPALIDIAETTRLAIADVVALAAQRDVEIALNAPVPIAVTGNAEALHMLVRNLVDNSVRYTPSGGRVDIAVWASSEGTTLTVDDSGPGIPAGDRERVFDRFYRRMDTIDANAATGSGLGLAIVRTIATRHHATVELRDSPLGGLQARICFPPAS